MVVDPSDQESGVLLSVTTPTPHGLVVNLRSCEIAIWAYMGILFRQCRWFSRIMSMQTRFHNHCICWGKFLSFPDLSWFFGSPKNSGPLSHPGYPEAQSGYWKARHWHMTQTLRFSSTQTMQVPSSKQTYCSYGKGIMYTVDDLLFQIVIFNSYAKLSESIISDLFGSCWSICGHT